MWSGVLIGIGVLTLTFSVPAPIRASELPPGVKSIHVNGYDMAYFEQGSGQPVVLVHGAMSDFRYFMDAVRGPGSWTAAPEADRQIYRDNAWTIKGMVGDKLDSYICADAGRITAPVLLIAGEKSPPEYAKMLDAIQSCLKRSERVVIRNSSHHMPRQNPTGFSEALLDFMVKH